MICHEVLNKVTYVENIYYNYDVNNVKDVTRLVLLCKNNVVYQDAGICDDIIKNVYVGEVLKENIVFLNEHLNKMS